VLSGMSTMKHVIENVAAAGRSGPGTLSENELSLVEKVQEQYRRLSPIPCTACKYCLPCQNNVNIPGILGLYNDAIMYGDVNRARVLYGIRIQQDERAEHCTECQECEELCPQEIPISEWMKKCHELLA